MARPSDVAASERDRAERLTWVDLEQLWQEIQDERPNDWRPGSAFEHLIVRGFALSGLRVEYAYDVPFSGRPLEQIDGMVYLGEIPFLVECKDRDAIDIEAIAKMRNQLARRPHSTMGCVFVSGRFTEPAIILTDFAAPHRITLWDQIDVTDAIRTRNFALILERKYHELCMLGLTDHSPYYREAREYVG